MAPRRGGSRIPTCRQGIQRFPRFPSRDVVAGDEGNGGVVSETVAVEGMVVGVEGGPERGGTTLRYAN